MLKQAHPAALSQPTNPMNATHTSRVLDAGLLSRDDAAKILGIAPLTLSRWVSSKKIRAYRVARRLRFSRGHLHEYLERVEVGSRR
jgi:excisionase family DNA binding protein